MSLEKEEHNMTMTDAEKSKQESHKYEVILMLGVNRELIGTKYLSQMVVQKVKIEELTNKELVQIIEAWESRSIPSVKTKNFTYLDRFPKMQKEENETERNFQQRYVKMIQRYIQTIF
jgi:hypothetical protein